VGSILVFKRTSRIPSGHVAVVAKIISAHEILVNHANWYPGTVSRGMSVIDTSAANDWTSVAALHTPSGTHGADYPTYGFVYPGTGPREIVEARAGGEFEPVAATSGLWMDGGPDATMFHLAVATTDSPRGLHRATPTRENHHRKEMAGRPERKQWATRSRATTRPTKTTDAKHHRA
jgi:hypothetical protein